MSKAWAKLQLAVQCLAKEGTQRDRLTAAIAEHLACLRPKDLPAEARQAFVALIDGLCLDQAQQQVRASVRRMVDALDVQEVDQMINSIIQIYDAVTRYQPMLSVEQRIAGGVPFNTPATWKEHEFALGSGPQPKLPVTLVKVKSALRQNLTGEMQNNPPLNTAVFAGDSNQCIFMP